MMSQVNPITAVVKPTAKDDFVVKLFKARNWWRLKLDSLYKPFGVTDATWRVLLYLQISGDGSLQKEIATGVGIEGPSLVRHLDNLEKKGLIERRLAKHDRRGKTVHLTNSAEPLLNKLNEAGINFRKEILKDFSEAEMQICVDVFDRLLTVAVED